jgi:hypothetical protein
LNQAFSGSSASALASLHQVAGGGGYGSLLSSQAANNQSFLQNAVRLGNFGQSSSVLGTTSSDELLLRQNLLNQMRVNLANQDLLASLPPSLQRQLLFQSLQQGDGNSSYLSSAGMRSLSSAAGGLNNRHFPDPTNGNSHGNSGGWF